MATRDAAEGIAAIATLARWAGMRVVPTRNGIEIYPGCDGKHGNGECGPDCWILMQFDWQRVYDLIRDGGPPGQSGADHLNRAMSLSHRKYDEVFRAAKAARTDEP